MAAISLPAFSDCTDLRIGSMASMERTQYSADIASGIYLDPPSASSVAARTKSDTHWNFSATALGVARALVFDSPTPSLSAAFAVRHMSRYDLVAVYSLKTP